MTDENAPLPKVEFSDKDWSMKSSCKTKVTVFSILTAVLLLGAVVSAAVFFALKKATPNARNTDISSKSEHRSASGKNTEWYVFLNTSILSLYICCAHGENFLLFLLFLPNFKYFFTEKIML